jgi:hypothetical protein
MTKCIYIANELQDPRSKSRHIIFSSLSIARFVALVFWGIKGRSAVVLCLSPRRSDWLSGRFMKDWDVDPSRWWLQLVAGRQNPEFTSASRSDIPLLIAYDVTGSSMSLSLHDFRDRWETTSPFNVNHSSQAPSSHHIVLLMCRSLRMNCCMQHA